MVRNESIISRIAFFCIPHLKTRNPSTGKEFLSELNGMIIQCDLREEAWLHFLLILLLMINN